MPKSIKVPTIKQLATAVFLAVGAWASTPAVAQSCQQTSVLAPSPFLGNHDEVVQLADGTIWKVMFEYRYLYAYYPQVLICPGDGKLIVDGAALNVTPLRGSSARPNAQRRSTPADTAGSARVVLRKSSCGDYFVAEGPSGFHVLEWYGGHDPSQGDTIAGDISGYGFKDVYYLSSSASGRVYVDDYALSKSRATEKFLERCR